MWSQVKHKGQILNKTPLTSLQKNQITQTENKVDYQGLGRGSNEELMFKGQFLFGK